jgi:hypothetical protein
MQAKPGQERTQGEHEPDTRAYSKARSQSEMLAKVLDIDKYFFRRVQKGHDLACLHREVGLMKKKEESLERGQIFPRRPAHNGHRTHQMHHHVHVIVVQPSYFCHDVS